MTGVTLSFVLLAYTGESVATTFLVTAGMFGGLAAYGATTPRSLTGLGQFLFMGLIGVVLASLVGIFWHSDALQFLISLVGVVVFAGLAAYDAQRLSVMAEAAPAGQAGAYAISGACSRPFKVQTGQCDGVSTRDVLIFERFSDSRPPRARRRLP